MVMMIFFLYIYEYIYGASCEIFYVNGGGDVFYFFSFEKVFYYEFCDGFSNTFFYVFASNFNEFF